VKAPGFARVSVFFPFLSSDGNGRKSIDPLLLVNPSSFDGFARKRSLSFAEQSLKETLKPTMLLKVFLIAI
jgi:hypothetical protein